MERKAMAALEAWRASDGRKPMVISGLRQTGKTWLVEEFGKTGYEDCITVNLESPRFRGAFSDPTDPERIVSSLSALTGKRITPDTLIFLDEVQDCPEALPSLKYFCEKAPEYHVIAAGSLLGVSVSQGRKYPVGKVDELEILPMSFSEFVRACGNTPLADAIDSYDTDILTAAQPLLADMLGTYMFVGGMPEAVLAYVRTKDPEEARKVQNRLVTEYERDMSRHPPKGIVARMIDVWDSLPEQLAKGNRKFVYSMMRSKGGASRYMEPILWLQSYGLVTVVPRAVRPEVPLSSVSDGKAFKLYAADVGLLGAKAGLGTDALLSEGGIFGCFRGAMTEQFVVQELRAAGFRPYYWSGGENEVDVLVEWAGGVVPIEVKASVNLRSKRLRAFRDRYGAEVCVRTSLTGFKDEGWLINVPLYSVSRIGDALGSRERAGSPPDDAGPA